MKKFLCDYESSLLEAIEVELPGCKPQGCFFHKRQAQKRKLGELHMLKKLKEDEEFLHSFNCFSALAFVDPQDVKTLFNLMIAEPRFHPDLKDYADQYVRPTWIEGPNGGRNCIFLRGGQPQRPKLLNLLHDPFSVHFSGRSSDPPFSDFWLPKCPR